jgi:nucleoside-diphosphate-sugar epimerase
MVSPQFLILGTGYTGHYLYAGVKKLGTHVRATSRDPEHNLAQISIDDRLTFDLARPATWPDFPPDCRVFWCFPAQPIDLVRRFADARLADVRRLIVLGSTSAYDDPHSECTFPPPWLDESASVDTTIPRVQGEEYLRTGCGAIVLRAAGIYGPGRNPLDWIRRGLVGPSQRYVNLIHVEDLAGICLELCERGLRGETYNVSDGVPRTWHDICRMARDRWLVTPAVSRSNDRPGKRIATAKLQQALRYTLKHPDLYDAIALIEANRAGFSET